MKKTDLLKLNKDQENKGVVMKPRISMILPCVVILSGIAVTAWGDYAAGARAYQKKDYVTALREFKTDGKASACQNIAVMYYNGEGVKQDKKEAAKWMLKAAELGHPKAQFLLSALYFTGDGIDQNIPEAIKWIKKSAENGFAEAQFNLGMMYINGDNIDKDRKEGVKWEKMAAKQGHVGAKKLLKVMGESQPAPEKRKRLPKGHPAPTGH